MRDPDSVFSMYWDLVQVCVLLYVAMLVPIRTAFEVDLELFAIAWWIELVVDIPWYTSSQICL